LPVSLEQCFAFGYLGALEGGRAESFKSASRDSRDKGARLELDLGSFGATSLSSSSFFYEHSPWCAQHCLVPLVQQSIGKNGPHPKLAVATARIPPLPRAIFGGYYSRPRKVQFAPRCLLKRTPADGAALARTQPGRAMLVMQEHRGRGTSTRSNPCRASAATSWPLVQASVTCTGAK